jgi:hypothetical protein
MYWSTDSQKNKHDNESPYIYWSIEDAIKYIKKKMLFWTSTSTTRKTVIALQETAKSMRVKTLVDKAQTVVDNGMTLSMTTLAIVGDPISRWLGAILL